MLWPSARPERVRELSDGEDALGVELLSLFCAHPSQQAEVIFLNCLLLAPGLELTLGTVPNQDKIRRRGDGKQRGHLSDQFPHLARQVRGLHLERGIVVSVN